MCRYPRVLPIGLLMLAALAAPALADLALHWYTVDGGGDFWSAGDAFELSGTIGQPDAGVVVMTGGNLELAGGFWAGIEPPCYGDLDDDSEIGLTDLAQLLGHYGTTSGATYDEGDLDGDGDVDLADLAELLGLYGTSCE